MYVTWFSMSLPNKMVGKSNVLNRFAIQNNSNALVVFMIVPDFDPQYFLPESTRHFCPMGVSRGVRYTPLGTHAGITHDCTVTSMQIR